MDKSDEISDSIPTGVEFEPASRCSAAVISPSDRNQAAEDLSVQLGSVSFDEVANGQCGTMTVSEANGDKRHDSKAGGAGGDEEEAGRGDGDESQRDDEIMNENKQSVYPLRPEAMDCQFYMRTGNCGYGLSCKFNHPFRGSSEVKALQAVRDNEEDENPEGLRKIACKYYLNVGWCKYGELCRFSHQKLEKAYNPAPELNSLGLPIRTGEKECPYYMQHGSCKFEAECKFNHPEPPISIEGTDSSFCGNGIGNGCGSIGSFSPKAAPQASSNFSRSSSMHLNGTAPFMPVMYSRTPGVLSRTSEWNGYHVASVDSPESCVLPASTDSVTETSVYGEYLLQMPADEFPERPDQPECSYYLMTGDCKFKYECKYHHPKNRLPKQPPCALNDKGLPLRPDQAVCVHYSQYGICKFGPACKFDHSVQPPCATGSSSSQAVEAPPMEANRNESDGCK